ncbi:hypothetical protein RF11_14769 [Thelohanellus kitauei]|uniref:BPTI/Kunitz inhibitor domain-containing protein n=1 Tax=Thelohanellus kitauei TaxID=669202 RepID=A0A0C2NB77_THEKT|nr:hypothetical protein RF11_14769 [Thelohanellus kitauei]
MFYGFVLALACLGFFQIESLNGMPIFYQYQGKCRAVIPYYYYDSNRNKCLRFSSCGTIKSRNRFTTLDVCNMKCYSHHKVEDKGCLVDWKSKIPRRYSRKNPFLYAYNLRLAQCVPFRKSKINKKRTDARRIEAVDEDLISDLKKQALDESTDIGKTAQFLIFLRGTSENSGIKGRDNYRRYF